MSHEHGDDMFETGLTVGDLGEIVMPNDGVYLLPVKVHADELRVATTGGPAELAAFAAKGRSATKDRKKLPAGTIAVRKARIKAKAEKLPKGPL